MKRTVHTDKERNKRQRPEGLKACRRKVWALAGVILAVVCVGGCLLGSMKERKGTERQTSSQIREKKEEEPTPVQSRAERIEQVKAQARRSGCPESIVDLIDKNDETIDFVSGYAQKKDAAVPASVEAPAQPGQIPHYLQWDERWGYKPYGTSTIAASGCGPTSMSMVIVGLTGDVTATPYALAKYSEENGFLDEDNNTYWAFMESAADHWGLECRETMLDEKSLASELEAGHPVICSMLPGDFTDVGHFLVLTGYEDGKVSLNDPFSKKNTYRQWVYADIKDQIREMWVMKKAG